MMEKIAFFESSGKQDAIVWAEKAFEILQNHKVQVIADDSLAQRMREDIRERLKVVPLKDFEKHADMVISFGGDGTMLAAARILIESGIPIMGVNVGKLGFLAEYPTGKLEQAIAEVLAGKFRVVDRTVLETEVEDGGTTFALNDFVIEKKDSSRMITLEAYSNDHYIGDYRADGLIVTTPTGSSAYSLSCGGPIIAPTTEVICLTPISPHTLTLRPLVIPDSNELRLKVYSPTGKAALVADGQVEKTLKNNETIVIRKSESKIKLIKPLDSSYFSVLRRKLLWAANTLENENNNCPCKDKEKEENV
jgi:NAD+ kinase